MNNFFHCEIQKLQQDTLKLIYAHKYSQVHQTQLVDCKLHEAATGFNAPGWLIHGAGTYEKKCVLYFTHYIGFLQNF